MPSRCAIVGCSTNSAKCRGLSFMKLPRQGVSEAQDRWRADVICVIGRIDTSFNPNNAMICSRHYEPDCITYALNIANMEVSVSNALKEGQKDGNWKCTSGEDRAAATRGTATLCDQRCSFGCFNFNSPGSKGKCSGLVFGSIPTRWLPQKSIVTPKTTRPLPTERTPPEIPQRISYWNYEDLRSDLKNVTAPWVVMKNSATSLQVGLASDSGSLQIVVSIADETGLQANVQVLGLPAPHLTTSLETVRLRTFLHNLGSMETCTGVTDPDVQSLAGPPDGKSKFFQQLRYKTVDGTLTHTTCVRSVNCMGLVPTATLCKPCSQLGATLQQKKQRLDQRLSQPLKPNDPLHSLQKEHLREVLREVRQDNAKLTKQLSNFQRQLHGNEAVELSSVQMHNSLSSLENGEVEGLSELQKLFWAEQQKAFKCKDKGMRWHPMMIRLAILLHSKSKAAYNTLRETGVLKLPGNSTLRDYTGALHPKEGFQPAVMEEVRKAAAKLPENERYVALLHDEMSIKSDLVYDEHDGSLVGFVNTDTWTFDDIQEELASHVLVFFIVGINSSLKMSIGYFGTRTSTADELWPLFWTAVGCLEEAGLKVITSTSNKASQNQRLYQLHQVPGQQDVCYKAVNIFAPERHIFFFSDPPHLIKTVRNNLESSGKATRLLWNRGHFLLWQHIKDVYNRDLNSTLRMTKLSADHIHLTPHAKMKVNLAAQVLSQRVGRVMMAYGPQEAQETARFILLMDRFFDCLNTRHLHEGVRKLKPDLKAYTDVSDPRFDFLEQEFLEYLLGWKTAVDNRPGQFSKSERQKMMLTHQTFRGLVMTTKAFVEATRYLLSHGVLFVLSNKFCQDPLEEHFGRHRSMGRSAENPNLYSFGHQEKQLRMQRQLALMVRPKGNVTGGHQLRPPVPISTSPLKKKKTTEITTS